MWMKEIEELERDIKSGMGYAEGIQSLAERTALPFNHLPTLIEITAAAQEAAAVYAVLAEKLYQRTLRLDPKAFRIAP